MRPKIIISTAMMGQLNPEQWKEVIENVEVLLTEMGLDYRVGLEIVAAYKEPLLSVVLNRVKRLGLEERVETIHGRVDYDWSATLGRKRVMKGKKFLELLTYDLFMAWVGEAYRGALKFKQAKLLLHAPTLFQLKVMKGDKPRLLKKRLIVENDEKLEFPYVEEVGDPFNPVDIYRFAEQEKLAKVVFDTAHFWRCFRDERVRHNTWEEFKGLVSRGKLPVYWHLNHNNGEHFIIGKGKHDEWLKEVVEFMGERMRNGEDQICFEEPKRVRFKMTKESMFNLIYKLGESLENLQKWGGL